MSIFDFIGNLFFILLGTIFQLFVEKFKGKQKFVSWLSFVLISVGMFWLGLEIGTKGSFELVSDSGRKNVEISVPMTNWDVNGETIGNSILGNNSHHGEFELSSVQAENSYTRPEQQLIYSWDSLGAFIELNGMPLRGVQSVISIFPVETKYYAEKVFCHYTAKYDGRYYSSVEQYIPFRQPVIMIWDFTGSVDPSAFDITEEDRAYLENSIDLLHQKGSSFTYYTRRLRELWQWQELVANSYDPNTVEKLIVTCNTSATKEYRGGNTGDRFVFRGEFNFGDVIVYPYEQVK
ncbi:MAG: hypothetical protein QY328_10625 [Anaerolineales bacterium]|nr:MAG: hypothetical protein QY328_10625 [Anaerolineales bacterium]